VLSTFPGTVVTGEAALLLAQFNCQEILVLLLPRDGARSSFAGGELLRLAKHA